MNKKIYYILLFGFELFGVRATAGARYLNIVLFGMSAVIFAEIIRRGNYIFTGG